MLSLNTPVLTLTGNSCHLYCQPVLIFEVKRLKIKVPLHICPILGKYTQNISYFRKARIASNCARSKVDKCPYLESYLGNWFNDEPGFTKLFPIDGSKKCEYLDNPFPGKSKKSYSQYITPNQLYMCKLTQCKKLNLPHVTQWCKDMYFSISPI